MSRPERNPRNFRYISPIFPAPRNSLHGSCDLGAYGPEREETVKVEILNYEHFFNRHVTYLFVDLFTHVSHMTMEHSRLVDRLYM